MNNIGVLSNGGVILKRDPESAEGDLSHCHFVQHKSRYTVLVGD